MRLGIAARISVYIAALAVLQTGLLCWFFVVHEGKAIRAEAEERARGIAHNLAYDAAYSTAVGDTEELKRLVEGTIRATDIVSAQIEGPGGTVLVRAERSSTGPIQEFSAAITMDAPRRSREELQLAEHHDGPTRRHSIGLVRLGLSLAGLQTKASQLRRVTLCVASVVLAFCSLTTLGAVRTLISGPLASLVVGVREFGRGNLAHRAPVKRQDEIGLLAATFNTMAEDLARTLVSKEFVDKVIESMTDALVVTDASGSIVGSNPAASGLLARRPDELVGRPLACLASAADSSALAKLPGELAAQEHIANLDLAFEAKGGERVPVLFSAAPMRDAEGNVQGVVGIAKDVSDVYEAREALAQEKERLTVTLRSIGDGVISTDTDGRITLLNREAEKLTGWELADAVGRPLADVLILRDGLTGERLADPVERILKSGSTVSIESGATLVSRDGTAREVADSGAPIRDKDSAVVGAVLVFRDITESQRVEEELRRAQKLEAVGILAGGIAHDFNNVLVGITMAASLGQLAADEPGEAKALFDQISVASKRAGELTRQLLTFSKGGEPVKAVVAVADLVTETATFATSGTNVVCRTRFADGLWAIDADGGQMSQVLNNLVINATQAMPQGGAIEVRCENCVIDGGSVVPIEAGRYVLISVKDTGTGISEDQLSMVFDPYFTTKAKGSGLGLATSYSIVARHGGHLTVESELGKGSTFSVYLPASDRQPTEAAGSDRVAAARRAKILVMDDESVIRSAMTVALTKLGHDVECAEGGEQALGLCREAMEAGERFDVVIMDLTIPGGMGGKEAIGKLLELDPDARAVVSSGYSNDPVMANYATYGFSGLLIKPYTLGQLAEVLRDVLGSPHV